MYDFNDVVALIAIFIGSLCCLVMFVLLIMSFI